MAPEEPTIDSPKALTWRRNKLSDKERYEDDFYFEINGKRMVINQVRHTHALSPFTPLTCILRRCRMWPTSLTRWGSPCGIPYAAHSIVRVRVCVCACAGAAHEHLRACGAEFGDDEVPGEAAQPRPIRSRCAIVEPPSAIAIRAR